MGLLGLVAGKHDTMLSNNEQSPRRAATALCEPAITGRHRQARSRPIRAAAYAMGLLAAVVVAATACSTPGEPAETGDPVPGTADIELDDVGVIDGTEGGIDLDNGNVPGSQNDQDLDPFDDENDLNTEE